MSRVPVIGARASIRCGCTRRSEVELIGMFGKAAFGKWPILDSTIRGKLGGAVDAQTGKLTQSVPSDVTHRTVGIGLIGKAN